MLKYALLGFLKYESKTGYEIKQTMDQSTGHFWHAKQSQIYTTLKKLEYDGLVISHPEPQDRRPDRRVYTITDSGGRALKDWLLQPVTKLDTTKQLLLLKLFFSGKLEKEDILTQLRLIHNLHEQQAKLYKTSTLDFIGEITALQPELKQDAHLWNAALRFGVLYEQMYVSWLDETIAMVDAKF
jgi:PadR family transcriptional regulator, regulatory protein AphA